MSDVAVGLPSRLGQVRRLEQEGLPYMLKFGFQPQGFVLQTFQFLGVLRGTDGTNDPLSGLASLVAERLDEGDGFGVLPGAFGDANEHGARPGDVDVDGESILHQNYYTGRTTLRAHI